MPKRRQATKSPSSTSGSTIERQGIRRLMGPRRTVHLPARIRHGDPGPGPGGEGMKVGYAVSGLPPQLAFTPASACAALSAACSASVSCVRAASASSSWDRSVSASPVARRDPRSPTPAGAAAIRPPRRGLGPRSARLPRAPGRRSLAQRAPRARWRRSPRHAAPPARRSLPLRAPRLRAGRCPRRRCAGAPRVARRRAALLAGRTRRRSHARPVGPRPRRPAAPRAPRARAW